MRTIAISHGMSAIVDDEDYERLSQWKWFVKASRYGNGFYARRYEGERGSRKIIWMHREVCPIPDGMRCDIVMEMA